MENLNYKRISLILLILVIILFITQMCNNTDRLQGQYDILKKQLSEQKQVVKETEEKRLKEKDSLLFVISQRNIENDLLYSEIDGLKKRIRDLKNKPISVPKDLNGLVVYFNQRYKTIENKVVDNKVGLVEDVAKDVVIEIEEGDRAIETVSLQEGIIKNQDTIISNLNKDKVDLSLVISSAENEITERKKLQEMSDENIKNLEKQVKKQKNKNFWNKVLIIGGSVGGFLLGSQL